MNPAKITYIPSRSSSRWIFLTAQKRLFDQPHSIALQESKQSGALVSGHYEAEGEAVEVDFDLSFPTTDHRPPAFTSDY